MYNWKEIVDQLPDVLKDLFYQTWNGGFKKCCKCGKTYPSHKLYFRVKTASPDNLNCLCKRCNGDKFISKRIGTVFYSLVPVGYKYCNSCKKLLPLTNKYFTLMTNNKVGFCSICKKCRGFSEYKVTVQGENVELIKKGFKKCTYCLKIKSLSEYKVVGKTRLSEYCSDCEADHKNKKSKYDRVHYEKIKDGRKIYYKEWKKNGGQEIRRIDGNKRRSLIKGLDNSFTLQDWVYCKSVFDNKCAYCGKEKKLTQDHFIPLTSGGEYTINNIIPACLSCNTSKNSGDFFKWYPEHKHYSTQRENKILKYLNYKNPHTQQLALL